MTHKLRLSNTNLSGNLLFCKSFELFVYEREQKICAIFQLVAMEICMNSASSYLSIYFHRNGSFDVLKNSCC